MAIGPKDFPFTDSELATIAGIEKEIDDIIRATAPVDARMVDVSLESLRGLPYRLAVEIQNRYKKAGWKHAEIRGKKIFLNMEN